MKMQQIDEWLEESNVRVFMSITRSEDGNLAMSVYDLDASSKPLFYTAVKPNEFINVLRMKSNEITIFRMMTPGDIEAMEQTGEMPEGWGYSE